MVSANGVTISGEMELGGLKSAERKHHFCVYCKSFVLTQFSGARERINLRATMLDDLEWFTPFVELMTAEKQPWVNINAKHSFRRFPENPRELTRLLDQYATSVCWYWRDE